MSKKRFDAEICFKDECVARPALFAQIQVTLVTVLVIPSTVIARLLIRHKVIPMSTFFTLYFALFNVTFVTALDSFVAINALSGGMVEEI